MAVKESVKYYKCLCYLFYINIVYFEVFGNIFLMISAMIIAEYFRFLNNIIEKLGKVSLEIYLIHILPNEWFLQDRILDNISIIKIVLWTRLVTILAKFINKIIECCSSKLKKLLMLERKQNLYGE